MKSNHTILLFSLLVCSLFMGCKKSEAVSEERLGQLIVYTYDSFSGEWGSGPEIAKRFEEKTGIKVVYSDCGSGVEILSKAILEKDDPYADVIVGVDNNLTERAMESGVLEAYKPAGRENLKEGMEESLGGKWLLTPYDYSPFAIIFNTNSGLEPPTCLEDLTKPIYEKKLIIMDPRTSTPGLGFDVWVRTVYGDKYDDYMKRLQPSILTMAPSWSVGYGMFTEGEAPMAVSYTTSPAYHVEYDEGDYNKALEFTDGHVMQVEGAGVLKNCKNPEAAKMFIDFLISEAAQECLPTLQWMYPVNKNVVLPPCYDGVISPVILN